eukprot:scaffold18904_cov112-Isochrysis_galbana.AAC.8
MCLPSAWGAWRRSARSLVISDGVYQFTNVKRKDLSLSVAGLNKAVMVTVQSPSPRVHQNGRRPRGPGPAGRRPVASHAGGDAWAVSHAVHGGYCCRPVPPAALGLRSGCELRPLRPSPTGSHSAPLAKTPRPPHTTRRQGLSRCRAPADDNSTRAASRGATIAFGPLGASTAVPSPAARGGKSRCRPHAASRRTRRRRRPCLAAR